MPHRLQDRVAIVTGASSGLGRAIALAYAAEGALLICSDLQAHPRVRPTNSSEAAAYGYDETSTPTHELILKSGTQAIFVACDVSDESQVEKLVAAAVSRFGRLDIMVNNAGLAIEGMTEVPPRIHETETETFDRTIRVNLKGVFLGCKYAAKQMLLQPERSEERGWIVNTASIMGLVGMRGASSYCASKGGVVNLSKSVALEYAADRIHCNALCPGFVDTAMISSLISTGPVRASLDATHPLKGLGKPEDIARAAVFLASDDVSWITGVALPVDGGFTCQ